MGNSNGKQDSELKGDAKYMERIHPGSTLNLKKWQKKYGFEGKLEVKSCTSLLTKLKIEEKTGEQKEKAKERELAQKWLAEAHKRKKGIEKSQNKKEQSDEFFVRPEDNETGPVQKRKPERQEEQLTPSLRCKQHHTPPPYCSTPDKTVYPSLPGEYTRSPSLAPRFSTPLQTRSTHSLDGVGWSKKWGKTLSPKPTIADMSCEGADLYPMVEVANPAFGNDGERRTMLVHRTWTIDDVKKAVAGLTSHRQDPQLFCQEMNNLIHSYHLNGLETQQAYMTAMGSDWAKVRGDWNPYQAVSNNNNAPPVALQHDTDNLRQQLTCLNLRTQNVFRQQADYTKIGQTQQKKDETVDDLRTRFEAVFKTHSGLIDNGELQGVYQQQLKNAMLHGCRPEIKEWITKHCVDLSAQTFPQFMNWVIHAEKVCQNKKSQRKEKKSVELFWQEKDECSEEGEVCYFGQRGCGKMRGRGQGQSFFRGRGGRRFVGQRRQANSDDECLQCGEKGHFARDCRKGTKTQTA